MNFFFGFADPLEIDAPLLKQPLHFMPDQSQAPDWLTETTDKLKKNNTSGFIIVNAEYNCTIPPALTNLLDYFPPAIFLHKPVSIVTYSMGELVILKTVQSLTSLNRLYRNP